MSHFGTLCVLVMCAAPVAAQEAGPAVPSRPRTGAAQAAPSDATGIEPALGIVNPGLLVLSFDDPASDQQRPPVGRPPVGQPRATELRIPQSADGFQWHDALKQYLTFLTFQHAVRLTQPKTYSQLGGPFWPDYVQSVASLSGWSDGDSFVTNYVAHPLMGAISGYIQIQNDPAGRRVEFGTSGAYWRSRAWAFAAAAIYSTQFELGPLSEASIGNVGLNPGTMAWVDLVMTPVGGLGWIVAEDAIDRFLIAKLEGHMGRNKIRLLRTFLNPNRSLANVIRFAPPWKRDGRDLPAKTSLRDEKPSAGVTVAAAALR